MKPAELEATFRTLYASLDPRGDGLDLRRAWAAFRSFLLEPIDDPRVRDDVAIFQCGVGTWETEEPGHPLHLSRQFWLESGPERPPVLTPAGGLIWGLTASFLFPPEAAASLGRVTLWSRDHATLGDFLDAVETSPSFQVAAQLRPLASRVDTD